MYIYADNMALTATCCKTLHENMTWLVSWAEENDLPLNKRKMVHMMFRKGDK